jgi:hypothetical protein
MATYSNRSVTSLITSLLLSQNTNIALADNLTNTAPVASVITHTSSGTVAAGFGVGDAVDLPSSTGVIRRATTDITSWTVATNGAEDAKRVISTFMNGAAIESGGYRSWPGPQPGIFIGPYSYGHGFRAATTLLMEMWIAGNIAIRFNSIAVEANLRFNTAKGVDVASATTITLGSAGNVFGITGATTITNITTTNWQAGSRITLILPSGITITHTAAATASTIFLRAAANLTTAKVYTLDLVFDGTQWRQPD